MDARRDVSATPGSPATAWDSTVMTTGTMRVVRRQRCGFVATVDADGTPNLSPTRL